MARALACSENHSFQDMAGAKNRPTWTVEGYGRLDLSARLGEPESRRAEEEDLGTPSCGGGGVISNRCGSSSSFFHSFGAIRASNPNARGFPYVIERSGHSGRQMCGVRITTSSVLTGCSLV